MGDRVYLTIPKDEYNQLVSDARELAEAVMFQANIEWKHRDQYPHAQRKYERDTETALRVLEAVNGYLEDG